MLINKQRLNDYLTLRDLTDVDGHAINLVLKRIISAMEGWCGLEASIQRPSPIVSVEDNYDRLYYPRDTVTRSERYSHYVDAGHLLRTHTSAAMPSLLRQTTADTLWVCPGLVYRRDVVDATHVGEPHQVDLWMVREGRVGRKDMVEMIARILEAIVPGMEYRLNETYHYYTVNGLEVEVRVGDRWVEVLECGEIHPWLLEESGLPVSRYSGLAMGLGLDRLVMLLKGLEDIRLLRSENPRVSAQMTNLDPYVEVSKYQATKRDMSICVEDPDLEILGDRMREALGHDASVIEDVSLQLRASWDEVPDVARGRLGMIRGQTNLLLRVTLRSLDGEITRRQGNDIYTRIYEALHEGTAGYKV